MEDYLEEDDFVEDELESIAIVGMSGRFPKANDIETFWKNLCEGVEALTHFTDEELIEAGQDPTLINLPNYIKMRPVLDDTDQFDAAFFDIPPSEAEVIDPQQRLFLECTWEALEQAGCDPFTYDGLASVFAGASINTYLLNNIWSNRQNLSMGTLGLQTTNSGDFLTTRVSYKLNLKGASFNLQSACSTSLVATHLACQNLLTYQCDLAIAGGSSVSPVNAGYLYQEGGPVSPDGHCRPFDADAQGTVFSNAVAVVVLKRLSEAIEDGDPIYAVIKGTGVNNDGSNKVGFTAPSVDGEMRAILAAQEAAEVSPDTISYIETHGTGTSLGDPIEIEALTQAFRQGTDEKQFCAIGSVKSNIGHTDSASGMCGLIKTALSLKHQQIPPSLNFSAPNPKIDFANSPFFVNTELRNWEQRNGTPRRAGLSSFGFGGTNAHAILEEAPERDPSDEPERRYQLITLSARTETALETMTDNLLVYLKANPEVALADVAYTLHVGRADFEYRRALVAESVADAITVLETRDPARLLNGAPMKETRSVAFMFSGQGSQYVNMGRDLYENELFFQEQVDTCAELLKPHLGVDLRDVLYPDADVEAASAKLTQTWLTQPALFTVEYALAQLLLSWGISPQAMLGHSIGEYVAACLSGVLSLESALAVVSVRGQQMQKMAEGDMLAVSLTEAELQPFLTDGLDLAVINAPNRCVVAGSKEAISQLADKLEQAGVDKRPLHTSHAFHSHMMEPMLETFRQRLQHIGLNEPQVPYLSNVTGTWITPEQTTDPHYWAQHVRSTVRFADGVAVLAEDPTMTLLEVGPGTSLRTLAQRHPSRSAQQGVLASMRHAKNEDPDDMVLLKLLGQLWLMGTTPNWQAFYGDAFRHRLLLPTYPFERQRYWIDANAEANQPLNQPLVKQPQLENWFYIPSWKRTLSPVLEYPEEEQTWLLFHEENELSQAILHQLGALNQPVWQVLMGDAFAVNGQTLYLRPDEPEDYQALWQHLTQQGVNPTQLLHLWNVTDTLAEDAQVRSFYSLLYLVQAIGQAGGDEQRRLGIVSTHMHQLASEQNGIHPEKGMSASIAKIVPQEMGQFSVSCLDVVLADAELLAEQFIAELMGDFSDEIVAYRGLERWVQTYEPSPIPDTSRVVKTGLRQQGVYLITGGLGGVGLTLAEHLASTLKAKLILTSRATFPPRSAWGDWLKTHMPNDRTSERIQTVQKLEELGAEVLIVQADVTDVEAMREAVQTAVSHFGSIHGVIHSAGVPGGGLIPLKQKADAQAVIAPKVAGTRALQTALEGQHPDFIMLCSSLTSVIGGVGQIDYCAANAFLDSFATAYHGQNGTAVMAINWDGWAEVGMAVNTNPLSGVSATAVIEKTAIDHPLRPERYNPSPTETIYELVLDADEHWLLHDHKVLDIPTAPGTTHLELVRTALTDKLGLDQFVITEAVFVTPLMVPTGTRRLLQVKLTETAQSFRYVVQSQSGVSASGQAQWQIHLMGEAQKTAPTKTQPTYDLQQLAREHDLKPYVLQQGQATSSGQSVVRGPHWNVMQGVQASEHVALAEIALREEFVEGEIGHFYIHPSMFDVATAFAIEVLVDSLYLPFSYEDLRLYHPIPRRIFSYVRHDPAQGKNQETVTLQVTILDENGRVLAEVENFSFKKVTENASTQMQTVNSSEPAKKERADLVNAILPIEGQELFARLVARNRLPQVIVSTRKLHGVIEQTAKMQETFLKQAEQQGGSAKEKHARPQLTTAYVAPRNEVERTVASIWEQVLGIDAIGIHDNFFELGGESVMGIWIVSQLREHGLPASPDVLFQNQTIAELAVTLKPDAEMEDVPLAVTGVQEAWLVSDSHFPHVAVLQLLEKPDLARLDQAFVQVASHHAILQAQFSQADEGWLVQMDGVLSSPMVTAVNLTPNDASQIQADLEAEIERLQLSFAKAEQPLWRGVWVQTNGTDYLLVAVSPLVADGSALNLLLSELQSVYEQLKAGEAVRFAPVPTPYKTWLRAWQTAVDETPALEEEPMLAMMPIDYDVEEVGRWQKVSTLLPLETYEQLQELPIAYHLQPAELVFAALGKTITEWASQMDVAINWLQAPPLEMETERTVGVTAVATPVNLFLMDWDDTNEVLIAVKEALRNLTVADMARAQKQMKASLTLTYTPDLTEQSLFYPEQFILAMPKPYPQLHLVVGRVGEQIELHWHYHTSQYQKQTMQTLLQSLEANLVEMLAFCLSEDDLQFAPSDFPDAGLDKNALNQFISKLTKK